MAIGKSSDGCGIGVGYDCGIEDASTRGLVEDAEKTQWKRSDGEDPSKKVQWKICAREKSSLENQPWL